MLAKIRSGLIRSFDAQIVDEFLASYAEAKTAYYNGGLRLNAVEGGRFSEAAFRMLEQAAFGRYTPIGRTVDSEKLFKELLGISTGTQPESVRKHIPRALRVIYDVRNNRDAAHLADGIDPNYQDATLVISVLDWVVAEFVRIYHDVSPNEAHKIVDELVSRRAPAIQEFNGFMKVLSRKLRAGDFVLLLLYERGSAGASYSQLEEWARPAMRKNLRRTLRALIHDEAYVHEDNMTIHYITQSGRIEVEKRRLHAL